MSHLDLPCPIIAATPLNAGHFVGFHDICPWSLRGDALAVLRIPADFDRSPQPDDVAEVCLWRPGDGVGGAVEPVAATTAWNLQQGARLQWRPGAERTLVWNARRGDRFHGMVLDLAAGAPVRELPCPIYALDPTGRWSLAPGFARLHRHYESYGYAGGTAPGMDCIAPAEDGIWKMDLETGAASLIVSVARAAAVGDPVGDPPVPQVLAHPSWSPSGSRLCFIHRWFTPRGDMLSRLFVCGPDGTDLHLVSDDRVSHFDWLDDDTLCVWARIGMKGGGRLHRRGLLHNSLVRPLVRAAKSLRPDLKRRLNNAGYWTFDVSGRNPPGAVPPRLVIERIEDGHQMFSRDRRWMVADTYPDATRHQTLMLFDLAGGRIFDIARLPTPRHGHGDQRCHLRPRWNRDSTLIAVDSDGAGLRQVLILDAGPVLAAAASDRKVA